MNKLYLFIVLMAFTVFFLGASSKEKEEIDIGCEHRQMLQVHRTEDEGFFWCVECNHYIGQWTKK